MADQSSAERLTAIAAELFGPEWAAPLARLTGTNERTSQRVRQAAREGREYPAAAGLLAALQERLSQILEALEPYGR